MCGIAGIYSLSGKEAPSARVITEMADSMAHRGPEDSGIYLGKGIAFGHRRLRILDLSEKGKQPMMDREKEIVITFNGEIYNFRDIRDELISLGYSFSSASDTEVILSAYRQWGIECIQRFNGMFAFGLYDGRKQKLFLVRDRLGKKPLYYSIVDGALIFASEIKAILRYPHFVAEPNWKAISSYLSFRYVLGKDSFFSRIVKVLPGHYLEISGGKIDEKEYWDIPLVAKKGDRGIAYYKASIREKLTRAVKLRMVSDVPLGAYLSGGLDSSIIVALMAQLTGKVRTYSVAFDVEGYDELQYAKLVAEKFSTEHTEIRLKAGDYMGAMKELIRFKDEPLAVPNEVPIYLMSKVLKKDITVVLSGEGSDELFYGYGRLFRSPFDYARLKMLPAGLRNLFLKSLGKKYGSKSFSSEMEHFLHLYSYFPNGEKNSLFNPFMKSLCRDDEGLHALFRKYFDRAENLNYYDKISYVFEKIHLVGLLGRLDNATMAAAVEARAPFVDHELVEFMFNVPKKYKLHWKSAFSFFRGLLKNSDEISENLDITKWILREAFKDDVPEKIISRKKQGFPVPLDAWFKGKFISDAKKYLLGPEARIRKIIDQQNLESWINRNLNNSAGTSFGQKVWMLLNVEIWLREYFG
ncbi:asparagine synthase (glutamine-hydrolyzing) [Candidatus Woesearchaeota archaeon]|nr:asparagine synthase (glutamine-hydrolyzing) [Candidatus Woesearchaeota archaeon]